MGTLSETAQRYGRHTLLCVIMTVTQRGLKCLLYYYNICCIILKFLGLSGRTKRCQYLYKALESCFHKPKPQSVTERNPGIAAICLQGDGAGLIWYNLTKSTQSKVRELLAHFWSGSLSTSHNLFVCSLIIVQYRVKALLLLSMVGMDVKAHSEKGELVV